jgi:hypothetical protein
VTTASASDAIGVGELRELARWPGAGAWSPFADPPYLLLRLDDSAPGLDATQEEGVARWLRRQPCPVIAIPGGGSYPILQAACDVFVADPGDANAVLDHVRNSPLAAMTVVQVLRVTEHLDIERGLAVESLAYSTLQGGPEFHRWLARRGAPRSGPRSPDDGPAVIVERHDERLDIRLNRPSRRNALSVEMRDGLCEALALVVADPSVRSARLSGNGKCFSSGGDLDEFGTAPDPATAHAVRSLRLPAALLVQCADRVEVRVHGACVGAGVELPAFARRVLAASDSFFQLPEVGLGLIPGAGGCVSIPRRIGRQRAAYMALSGARIGAAQALDWGLIDAIVD